MSDIDELGDRLDVVEDQVAQLSEDAAATRVLAAMADRDVAVFRNVMRGHTRVLNAIRETQVEQGPELRSLRETQVGQGRTLAEHGQTLAEHGQTLAGHGQVLEKLAGGQDAIMRHLGIVNHDGGEQTRD